jgi:hypothetical protein
MSGQAEEHARVGPVEFVYDQVDDCEITADYYIPKTSSDDQALPLSEFDGRSVQYYRKIFTTRTILSRSQSCSFTVEPTC